MESSATGLNGTGLQEKASSTAEEVSKAGKTFSSRLREHADAINSTIRSLENSDSEAAHLNHIISF